jgi:murein DD-endopeptidase MepM/ murein hydrolase activator NlpD
LSAEPALKGSGGPFVGTGEDELRGALAPDGFELGSQLTMLERDLDQLGSKLVVLDQIASERNLELMAFPGRLPIPDAEVGSAFGHRRDPFTHRVAFHSGQDFPAPWGAPIRASGGGKVAFAGYRSQYGLQVEIDHGNGLVSRYSHCSKVFVKAGDVVAPGQRVAAVGSTGRSTGAHLHFEIMRDGQFLDPSRFIGAALARAR